MPFPGLPFRVYPEPSFLLKLELKLSPFLSLRDGCGIRVSLSRFIECSSEGTFRCACGFFAASPPPSSHTQPLRGTQESVEAERQEGRAWP